MPVSIPRHAIGHDRAKRTPAPVGGAAHDETRIEVAVNLERGAPGHEALRKLAGVGPSLWRTRLRWTSQQPEGVQMRR